MDGWMETTWWWSLRVHGHKNISTRGRRASQYILHPTPSLRPQNPNKHITTVQHNTTNQVRIVLNKADTLDRCALTRVYGALMWAMGKILETPEVVRVFIG
jgi:hypothetical protein